MKRRRDKRRRNIAAIGLEPTARGRGVSPAVGSSCRRSPKRRGRQVGGDHYRTMAVQPWDAMRAWFTAEAFAGFLKGNVIKYLARADQKGGLEDLKKARHYLDELVELAERGGRRCGGH